MVAGWGEGGEGRGDGPAHGEPARSAHEVASRVGADPVGSESLVGQAAFVKPFPDRPSGA